MINEKILVLLLLGVSCSMLVNGFLFSTPFKNGCDPNPCKHKSECKLDPRNSNKSTCICTDGFHGRFCELKTGCNPNPCKHKAECVVDRKNQSLYTCKCPHGYLGNKCDAEDECKRKNPCKNDAKCTLDSKNKPLCECKPGWTSAHCDKRDCTIVEHRGKYFTKQSPRVYVDKSVEKDLKSIDDIAKQCKVKMHILGSFILHPDPKKGIYHDPSDTNAPGQYTGDALSMYFHDENNQLLCNEICLKKAILPTQVKCFITQLKTINWTWTILRPTVFSAHSYLPSNPKYTLKREQVQIGCRDKKF